MILPFFVTIRNVCLYIHADVPLLLSYPVMWELSLKNALKAETVPMGLLHNHYISFTHLPDEGLMIYICFSNVDNAFVSGNCGRQCQKYCQMKPQKQIYIIIKRSPFFEKAFLGCRLKNPGRFGRNSMMTIFRLRLFDSSNRKPFTFKPFTLQ